MIVYQLFMCIDEELEKLRKHTSHNSWVSRFELQK